MSGKPRKTILDLRKMVRFIELFLGRLKTVLSEREVAIATLSEEKQFLTFQDGSGIVAVLRKSSI